MPKLFSHAVFLALAAAGIACTLAAAVHAGTRAIEPDDFYRIADVREAQVSPDGAWVVYVVGGNDRASDEPRSSLWMVSWDGRQRVQLTVSLKDAAAPRFSPDGSSIAFLATPVGGEQTQIMLLVRRGGEPRALTHLNDNISEFEWAPDGKRIALVANGGSHPDEKTAAGAKLPKPMVIDTVHFKQGIEGYIEAGSWQRVKLLDMASRELIDLTADTNRVESHPTWSPNGRSIAYVRARGFGTDPDGKQDLMRVDATPGAVPQGLARVFAPNDQQLQWSPDGKHLAHFEGLEPKLYAYMANRLFTLPAGGVSRW